MPHLVVTLCIKLFFFLPSIVLGEVDLCDSDDDLAESTPTPNKPTIATQPEPVSKPIGKSKC